MAETWIKISLVCLLVSLLMQLFSLTTPGWYIYVEQDIYTSTYQKLYFGLFYVVLCPRGGHCTSKTITSYYQPDLEGRLLYAIVTRTFNVLLTWLLTASVVAIKLAVVVKGRQWKPAFWPVCMLLLSIANTLQWQIVSDYANLAVTSRNGLFPWCVLLHGIGALCVSAVALCHVVIFITRMLMPAFRMSASYGTVTSPDTPC